MSHATLSNFGKLTTAGGFGGPNSHGLPRVTGGAFSWLVTFR
jgi:hypothetical protein